MKAERVPMNNLVVCQRVAWSHLKEKIDSSPKSKYLMYWLEVAVSEICCHLQ